MHVAFLFQIKNKNKNKSEIVEIVEARCSVAVDRLHTTGLRSVAYRVLSKVLPSFYLAGIDPSGFYCVFFFPGFFFYWLLPSCTELLLGLNGFFMLFLGFTEFYWVLLGFTGFYWVLLGFHGFYWVSVGFSGFYWVLLGFTGFHQVLLGFTRF